MNWLTFDPRYRENYRKTFFNNAQNIYRTTYISKTLPDFESCHFFNSGDQKSEFDNQVPAKKNDIL